MFITAKTLKNQTSHISHRALCEVRKLLDLLVSIVHFRFVISRLFELQKTH